MKRYPVARIARVPWSRIATVTVGRTDPVAAPPLDEAGGAVDVTTPTFDSRHNFSMEPS